MFFDFYLFSRPEKQSLFQTFFFLHIGKGVSAQLRSALLVYFDPLQVIALLPFFFEFFNVQRETLTWVDFTFAQCTSFYY